MYGTSVNPNQKMDPVTSVDCLVANGYETDADSVSGISHSRAFVGDDDVV